MNDAPRDTVRDRLDEETTLDDLPHVHVPTYEQAPPTIETRSPFASKQPTVRGMPSLALDPKITEKPVAIVPPVIVGLPGQSLAGPTEPDGHPLTSSWEGPTDAELGEWVDAAPTDVMPRLRQPTPAVPPPGSPTFEISKSLEVEAARVEALAKARPKTTARPPRKHVSQVGPGPHAPTEVLPSLKRKPEREGSDWPLILGLLALALVIAALIGAASYGVVRTMRDGTPSAPAEPAR